jgi:LicD family
MSLAAPLFDLTKPAVRTDAAGYTHAKYAQYTKVSQHIYSQILKIFQKFDLQYYLFAGSALGYVRNGEMQPWVDDLDIILFEEHIEHFETMVLPFLKRCGLHCAVPAHFKKGGYHILAMQQGKKRTLTIPFSDDLEVSVPWAQVDVFFTTIDAEGFLRNPSAWGLYHKKDVPLDWVVPGQEVTFEGWETRLFSKCEEDVLHEYGDVLNHILVATHGKVFLNRPKTAWADFEASFDQLVAESTTDYPPCCDAQRIAGFQPEPGAVYATEAGQSFDRIVAKILAERASRLHLRDGDQIYWVMDLKRLFPTLQIDVDITSERELYRAALLRAFIDEVHCPDVALTAQYQTCSAHLAEIDA